MFTRAFMGFHIWDSTDQSMQVSTVRRRIYRRGTLMAYAKAHYVCAWIKAAVVFCNPWTLNMRADGFDWGEEKMKSIPSGQAIFEHAKAQDLNSNSVGVSDWISSIACSCLILSRPCPFSSSICTICSSTRVARAAQDWPILPSSSTSTMDHQASQREHTTTWGRGIHWR